MTMQILCNCLEHALNYGERELKIIDIIIKFVMKVPSHVQLNHDLNFRARTAMQL